MTKEEAEKMSPEKVFLHMEARLAVALEETKKKYGEDVADLVRRMIADTMKRLMLAAREAKQSSHAHIVLCAWMETMARWNEQIDALVRK